MSKAAFYLLYFLLLWVLCAIPASHAQEPALLTIVSEVSRFEEESPLHNADRFAELAQLDMATGLERAWLPLWGANAPAYASHVIGLSWSGKRLALVLQDQRWRASLVIYDSRREIFTTLLDPDSELTNFSPVSWHDQTLVFSAVQDNTEQIFMMETTLQPVLAGRLPVFAPDGRRIAYLTDTGLHLWEIETQTDTTLPLLFPDAHCLGWSGDFLTITEDAKIYLVDVESGNMRVVFEGEQLSCAAWSPDGKQLAFTRLEGMVSQVVTLDITTGALTIHAERDFATLPADPRIYTQVVYQPPGSTLPGGGAGDF